MRQTHRHCVNSCDGPSNCVYSMQFVIPDHCSEHYLAILVHWQHRRPAFLINRPVLTGVTDQSDLIKARYRNIFTVFTAMTAPATVTTIWKAYFCSIALNIVQPNLSTTVTIAVIEKTSEVSIYKNVANNSCCCVFKFIITNSPPGANMIHFNTFLHTSACLQPDSLRGMKLKLYM